ncbi:PcsB-like coiled-coil domain-containing protein, partial [Deinococcus pimensis]|uniref:PcsB-like coiled-coil domain-containing protein n=1 Tax=Deinococcus pimensis TaxID=309888 RepID=UPI003CCC390F
MNARRARSVALLALLAVAGAQTTSQKLQDLQQQLSRQKQLSEQQKARLAQLRQDIAALGTRQRAAIDRIDELGDEIGTLERQSRDLTQRILAVQDGIRTLEGQISVTNARVERLKADVRQLMRAVQRERSGQYLALLAQARSISDFVVRAKYVTVMGQQNVSLVRSLREEAQKLDEQRAQRVALANQLTGLKQEAQAKLSERLALKASQEKLLAELRDTEQGRRALALRTEAQRQLTATTIDDLVGQVVTERARIEAERRAREEAERLRREEEARRLR